MHHHFYCAIFLSAIILDCGLCNDQDKDARILYAENEEPSNEGYKYRFNTSNGIQRSETGILEKRGEETILKVQGHSQYTAPDGSIHIQEYVADDKGFRTRTRISAPSAESLPPPEINQTSPTGVRIGTTLISTLVGPGK